MPSTEPSNAALEQAAYWYAKLRDDSATPAQHEAWLQWLDTAAEHRTAWSYVEQVCGRFAPLSQTPNPRLTSRKLQEANSRLLQRRRVLTASASVVALGVLAGLGSKQGLLPASISKSITESISAWGADCSTAIGEQREWILDDGTRLWLNTDSAANIHYDADIRRIQLLSGEIFIETAKDPGRSLVVDTAQGRLRALGTVFNVRQLDSKILLSVIEGAVEIQPGTSSIKSIVNAGQQQSFNREVVEAAVATDATGAWTRGVLVAHNMPLKQLVDELRRYQQGHIGVADEVSDLRVYGQFPVQDSDRVLQMLTTVLPVRIHRTLPWWVCIEPSQPGLTKP
ncbi:FecR domain-containing protein [Marinobacterium lutimaris]|uniref:FecR family protein n=1 Tax=Marinobacterium lutimaris TaxID=568106 RepID=A0A1H6DLQ5_9GAMM|nr:FecR family protein [Marinobacterium lutimaris]SEG86128.1 FecR family protein [Marinobacterium lutimaris]